MPKKAPPRYYTVELAPNQLIPLEPACRSPVGISSLRAHCERCWADTRSVYAQEIGNSRLCSDCETQGYFLQLYCDNLSGCQERHQVLVQRRIGG